MEALVTRRQRHGLTWSALSEESGVPLSTLHQWHRRLREPDRGRRRQRFVAVAVTEPERAAGDGVLEVVLRSGHRVRVTAGFDPEHLRRVIVALESGC
jgi:transposase-like protein